MWMKGPYTEMWEDEMRRLAHRLNRRSNATVVHHETCPICGRKLVNLYLRENEWKCRLCWEKHDADPPVKLGPGKLVKVDKDGTHTLLGEVKEERPLVPGGCVGNGKSTLDLVRAFGIAAGSQEQEE